jgi:hypothetical protein
MKYSLRSQLWPFDLTQLQPETTTTTTTAAAVDERTLTFYTNISSAYSTSFVGFTSTNANICQFVVA